MGIMEGEKEGQNVDLVQEMDSLKVAVKKDLGKSSVKNKILTKAKSNKGMQEAAQGEITMTDVEAEMTAESATKAPTEAPTMAPLQLRLTAMALMMMAPLHF